VEVMSERLPIVYLARHGETAWTLSRQHTGLTDLPLTERGERTARRLGERLKALTFTAVLTSPLQRAARTCELAGFKSVAEVDKDLVERMPRGRVSPGSRRACGPGGKAGACRAGQCPDFHERALHAGARDQLARAGAIGQL
jgi:hypothetical protein